MERSTASASAARWKALRGALLAVPLILLSGCTGTDEDGTDDDTGDGTTGPDDPCAAPPGAGTLVRNGPRDAPSQAPIGGADVRLEAYLWRDFQPIAPPCGDALRAAITLHADGGVPEDVRAERIWVWNGEQAWTVEPEAGEASEPGTFTAHAADGPKWGPGIDVQITVLVSSPEGPAELGLRDVPIERTD